LVASISRGIKVINLAGGAHTLFFDEGVSRVPAFEFFSLSDLKRFAEWTATSQEHFRKLVAGVTSHGKLLYVTYFVEGNRLHLQLEVRPFVLAIRR
jgi:hydroxymethylglutaryl-CoA reductase (NADPH)